MTTSAHHDATVLLLGSAVQELAFRVAQIALPLVVLAETGSVALTGLVAGAAGLPVLLSPWWARRLRQLVSTGPRLAVVSAVEAVALLVTPVAAALGVVGAPTLAAAGLLLGVTEALGNPARTALLADVGDRLGPDRALTLVTAQDAVRRGIVIVGPVLGGVTVGAGITHGALWIQTLAVLVSGALATRVGTGRRSTTPTAPGEPQDGDTIRAALRPRPEVAVGWVLRGTFSFTWFAFVLGLSVLGEESGRPGQLLAAGMSGYGAGALLATAVATRIVDRAPLLTTARVAWSVAGASWVVMAGWSSLVGVATCAFVGAFAISIGIAAINGTITRTSTGTSRRTLFSGQAAVVSGTSAAGMLVGGAVLGALGVSTTLAAAGVVTVVVALVAPAAWRSAAARGASARHPRQPVVSSR